MHDDQRWAFTKKRFLDRVSFSKSSFLHRNEILIFWGSFFHCFSLLLLNCVHVLKHSTQNSKTPLTRYTQNFRAKWPSVSWVRFASLSCGLQIFCHFTVKMVETTLIFSAAKTSFDPQVQGCLIIGKPRNLQTVTFDNLAEKLSPRVDAAVRHFFLFYSIKIYVYNNWFYFQFE